MHFGASRASRHGERNPRASVRRERAAAASAPNTLRCVGRRKSRQPSKSPLRRRQRCHHGNHRSHLFGGDSGVINVSLCQSFGCGGQDICRLTVARSGFTTGNVRGLNPSGARPRSWNRRWRAASSKLACRWLQHGEAASVFAGQYPRVPVYGLARNTSSKQTLSGAGSAVVFTVVHGLLSTAGFPS
jgi:hypothetical protein